MKKRRIGKKLWSLTLTLAMVLTMTVTALPAYAAAGGTISVTFDPKVDGLTSTTFNVYKVGTYSRDPSGKSILVIDSAVKAISGVDLDDSVLAQDSDAGWLSAASTIAQYTDKLDSVKVNSSPSEVTAGSTTAVATATTNGIYLIVGDEVKVGDLYWWPVPVLIQVLNGSATYTFDQAHVTTKMDSKPVVYKHNVKKSWNDDNNKNGVRPESLDVEIMYGEKVIDTVTLSDANNWNYTWTTTEAGVKKYSSTERAGKFADEEAYPGEGPYTYELSESESEGSHTWSAREVFTTDNKLLYNYYIQEDPVISTDKDGVEEYITLKNTFDVDKLKIYKELSSYATMGTGMNAPVVFEITGYGTKVTKDSEGEDVTEEVQMYHTQTSLVFNKPGKDSVELNNIPANLTRLVIEEKYSENYKAEQSKFEFAKPTEEDGKSYVVTFKNSDSTSDDDPPTYTGSIVNKFSKGENGNYTYKGQTGLQQAQPQ